MLYLIAKIDEASRERLLQIQQLTEKSGISAGSLYGHITLAVYTGDAGEDFISSCKAILRDYSAFTVHYDKIEVLSATSIIVASIVNENEIADIQRKIVKKWAEYLNEWTQETTWYPHTTLVYHPQADLNAIAKVMQDRFVPFDAQVERIEVSREKGSGYEIVDVVELR